MNKQLDDTQPRRTRPSEPDATQVTPARAARLKHGEPANGEGKTPRGQREGGRLRFLRSTWLQASLAAVLVLLLVTAASGAAGWGSGRAQLGATATVQAGLYMFEQYNLALADMEAGNYELARQRLEFIFVADANFLDVADKWVEVMLVLGQTSVPTSAARPSPSATPTEDPRPKEELLAAAQALIAIRDWSGAIDTLLALRKADLSYHTADVDGMLYLALRNRGVQNILELGLFEPGLYDFSLAEKFGPLDGQALNYREWARLYLYGNAFWLAYPEEAAYYYGQLVGMAPDLRDSSGLSAFYRYWQSLVHYADQLAAKEDWCAASGQYEVAQGARQDAGIQPTANYAQEQCILLTPSATPSATGTATPTLFISFTPSPTGSVSPSASSDASPSATATGGSAASPTPTPSRTPTASQTVAPSLTPTPSQTPTTPAP